MKKLILMFALLTGVIFAQDISVKSFPDTTALKLSEETGIVLLEKFGGATDDKTGGGLFHFADSSIAEGTHAFDHPYTGKQWVRIQYEGGEEQDFNAATIVTLTLTTVDAFATTGDITLENDEIIDNGTDGDIIFIYDDAAVDGVSDIMSQFIIQSSVDTPSVNDSDYVEMLFQFNDDSSGQTSWIEFEAVGIDVSDESEDSELRIKTWAAGSQVVLLKLAGSTATITGGLTVSGLLTNIGGGSYTTADGDNDLGVDGDLEVNGATDLDGALTVAGTTTLSTLLQLSLRTTAVGDSAFGVIHFSDADSNIYIGTGTDIVSIVDAAP